MLWSLPSSSSRAVLTLHAVWNNDYLEPDTDPTAQDGRRNNTVDPKPQTNLESNAAYAGRGAGYTF